MIRFLSDFNFGAINDVYIAEERFAYIATTTGVQVLDLLTSSVVGNASIVPEPTAVAVDSVFDIKNLHKRVYIGTMGSGILSVDCANTRIGDFTSSLEQRFTTSSIPPIIDNRITDLDVKGEMLLATSSGGVDFIVEENWRSHRPLTISGSGSCFLTASGGGYWEVSLSGVEVNYDLLTTTGTGVIDVDFEYNSFTSNPQLPFNIVNDLAVSTANSQNVLAFATSSGVLLVEETQGSEFLSPRRNLLSFRSVSSNAFSAAATYSSGRLYMTFNDDTELNVLNLANDSIVEQYTPLEGERGQTIISGTLTTVRTTTIG